MRKTRSDAVLLNLPEEQQAKLADWLLSGVPYHEAKVLAEKEFGVSLKSLDPFKGFWREVCQPHLLRRRARALSTAEARAEESQKHSGSAFDTATLDAIKQKAYELAESPEASSQDVKSVMMLLLKARDQDFEERRLAMDLNKFQFECCERFLAWFKDAKAREIAESTMGNADKIAALRREYFKDVDALQQSGAVKLPE